MKKIAIIGAGFSGLTVAYELAKRGYKVAVFEKSKHLGGLAAGYKLGDVYVDYFYRHIFASDSDIIDLAKEVGFTDWVWKRKNTTSTLYDAKIYPFNTPLDLLKFSPMSLSARLRTGLFSLVLRLKNNPGALENISAVDWVKKYMGEESYRVLWEPLMAKKFHSFKDEIIMMWLWARLAKRSNSLGYPVGGFEKLADLLAKKIIENGGKIFLNQDVKSIKSLYKEFDKIVYTGPVQELPNYASFLPEDYKKKCLDRESLGAIVLSLEYSGNILTDNYWININSAEPRDVVCVVNHSSFMDRKNYQGMQILYIGGYFEQNDSLWKKDKKDISARWLPFIKKLDTKFDERQVKKIHLLKARYAQPVFNKDYKKRLLPFATPDKRLYLVSMDQVYPYDRGVNNAVKWVGKFLGRWKAFI